MFCICFVYHIIYITIRIYIYICICICIRICIYICVCVCHHCVIMWQPDALAGPATRVTRAGARGSRGSSSVARSSRSSRGSTGVPVIDWFRLIVHEYTGFWIISGISDRDHWSPIIDLPCGSPIVLFESFTRSLFKDCRTQRTWAGDDCRGAKIDVFIFKLPITANHSQLLPRSEAPAREKGCGLFPTEWTCKRVSKYY